MPQDIVITPNRGSTTSGAQIAFTGYSGASSIYLKVLPDSSLSFEGAAGQLFSITDNLSSGTIFSVNDITGIPSFDVNANGAVRIAPYAGNLALGGTYASGELHIFTGNQANKGIIIQSASGQTANYLEVQNTSGLIGARIDSSMNFTRPVSGQTYSEQFGAGASAAAYAGTALGNSASANYLGGTAIGQAANAGNQYATAVGFQANSAYVAGTALGWSASAGQNGVAIGRSTNSTAGGIAIGYSASTSAYGDIVFNAAGDGVAGITNLVLLAGTASANSFYKQHNIYGTWISNVVATRQGRVQLYVADYGGDREALRYESNLSYALASIGGSAVLSGQSLSITAPAASYTPLTLKGATSQTANLQTWQNSAGSTIAYVNASGSFGGTLMSGTINNGYNFSATGLASGYNLRTDGTGVLSWAAAAGGLTVSDDTSTNATRYLTFTSATTGSVSTINVSSTKLTFNPSTGDFTAGGNITANSDARIKTNIKTLENALDKVKSLRGVSFERKDSGIKNIGVIAQEVEAIVPELVRESDGLKSVAYGNIVALLIEAVKEQNKKIEELEKICQSISNPS